jgi:hypothetical protein
VYSRVTCKEALNAHEAEGDVVMLITCAAVYGERFVAYANEKSKKFSEMPMMKPGKKSGRSFWGTPVARQVRLANGALVIKKT